MAKVEYYLQTLDPASLSKMLSNKLKRKVVLRPVNWEVYVEKPQLKDFSNWYVWKSFQSWRSEGHLKEINYIQECRSLVLDSLESHNVISGAWWKIERGPIAI